MTVIVSIISLLMIFLIAGLTWIVWMAAGSQYRDTKFNNKKNLFDWHYSKLLLSYKIKILKDEIKKRNVSMEELNDIMNEALGTKVSNKHVLDKIEDDVKGEVKKLESKK